MIETILKEYSEYKIEQKGKYFYIYVPYDREQRKELLEKIATDYKLELKSSYKSSLGMIQNDDKYIIIKPLNRQGDKSSGLLNEIEFSNLIKDKMSKKIKKIIFIDENNRKYELSELKDICIVGRKKNKRDKDGKISKADIIVKGKIDYYISLKKTNSQSWESATNYSVEIKKILDFLMAKKKVQLINQKNNYYKISREVLIEIEKNKIVDFVFGNDILKNGVIIKHDFDYKNVVCKEKKNICYIYVKELIFKTNHLRNKKFYFLVRNSSQRNIKNFYKGLRIVVVTNRKKAIIVNSNGEILNDV